MKHRKACSEAIDRYHVHRRNAENRATEDGCHGVLSMNQDRALLVQLIDEYEALASGKKLDEIPERQLRRGVYVNQRT